MTEEIESYVRLKFYGEPEFANVSEFNFQVYLDQYKSLPVFGINQNIHEVLQSDNVHGTVNECVHFIMRAVAQYHLENAFKAMKIDMTDLNVAGPKGTPYRIVKTWAGANLYDDTELMSGRWAYEPRIALFENKDGKKDPIFVVTDLSAVCSHHAIRFGTDYSDGNSFAVVGYIPEEQVLGISKINRFVRWVATRGWLQEDLTKTIGEKITKISGAESVYVALFNMKHGCASYRGAHDTQAATTTIYKTGRFEEESNLVPLKYQG